MPALAGGVAPPHPFVPLPNSLAGLDPVPLVTGLARLFGRPGNILQLHKLAAFKFVLCGDLSQSHPVARERQALSRLGKRDRCEREAVSGASWAQEWGGA